MRDLAEMTRDEFNAAARCSYGDYAFGYLQRWYATEWERSIKEFIQEFSDTNGELRNAMDARIDATLESESLSPEGVKAAYVALSAENAVTRLRYLRLQDHVDAADGFEVRRLRHELQLLKIDNEGLRNLKESLEGEIKYAVERIAEYREDIRYYRGVADGLRQKLYGER